MSSCQKDVKCQKNKHLDYGGGSQKKLNWHNEVHTHWCQFWCHIWSSPKTLKMSIESVFDQFWWPLYLMSKLTSICVNLTVSFYFLCNLRHSPDVWPFDIWHLFDNLTSFPPKFIIFLKNWFILKKKTTDPLINNLLEMKYRWLPP